MAKNKNRTINYTGNNNNLQIQPWLVSNSSHSSTNSLRLSNPSQGSNVVGPASSVNSNASAMPNIGNNLSTNNNVNINIGNNTAIANPNLVGNLINTLTPVNINNTNIRNIVPAIDLQKPSVLPTYKYPIDTLNVSETRIINGRFEPVMDGGIASFRPEIIGIFDFSPIYKVGTRTKNNEVGDFIDIQYQASHLRKETLIKLINKIQIRNRKTSSDDQFIALRNRYNEEVAKVETTISSFQDILSNIETIKNALQIKQIPKYLYNAKFLPLEEFFAKKMQYSKNQFAIFSDSKIIAQLLFDFRAILENYSVNLLDLNDPNREQDYSPITIDKTYTITNGFAFNIANMRSTNVATNATNINFFNAFINSLPQNLDDRIKILTLLISKEYMISKALGKPDVQRQLQAFGAQSIGNPFDNLIGEPGETILQKPKGQNSLISLLFVDPGIPNASVLPFESKHIDSYDQKSVYVPGSTYFIDSILNTSGTVWNTAPFVNYVNLFNERLNNAKAIIENMFSFNDSSTLLSPISLNDSFLQSLKASISSLEDNRYINTTQALIVALFKLAATDNQLKLMLFQFALLVGMSTNATEDQKDIFAILAKSEINSLRALSFLRIPMGVEPNPARGQSTIKPYIEQLAKMIERRVIALTSRLSPNSQRIMETTDILRNSSLRINDVFNLNNSFNRIGVLGFSDIIDKNTVTVNLQRGNITQILKDLTSSGGDNRTNFLEEFVEISTSLFKAAQIQGTNAHLLQDGTNRTRFNFLSISTQLLLIYEIIFAYANRYAFASFRRNTTGNLSITIDILANKSIISTVNNIINKSLIENLSKNKNLTNTIIGTTALEELRAASNRNLNLKTSSTNVTAGGSTVYKYLSSTGIKFKNVVNPGAGIDGGRQQFSNSIYNSVSADIQKIFVNNNFISETISTNIAAANSIKNIITNIGDIENVRDVLRNANKYLIYNFSLTTNRNKILDEINAINNCLHILTVIGLNLQKGSAAVQRYFNQSTLQTFLRNIGAQNLGLLKNPGQLRTSSYIMQHIKEKTPAQEYHSEVGYVQNNLVISDTITIQEYRMLRALLATSPFINNTNASPSANNRIKILSVGIPSGFSRQLVDRVNVTDINAFTFGDKQYDVISINVFKRDARFDDLVFKPIKYIFDLSLYTLEADINRINPDAEENFFRLMARAQITDFSNIKIPKKIDFSKIVTDEKYNFLSAFEIKQMMINHYVSYLLQLYINLLTGLKLTEDVFIPGNLSSGVRNLTNDVLQAVINYIRDVMRVPIPANQSVTQLLQNSSINEDAKDIIRLFNYGSLIFNEQEVYRRVLMPKLFDRVFNIPLNIEDFEIDVDKTLSTESGRRAWSQAYLQEKIFVRADGKYFMKPREKNELIFEDYFVAVETVNDKENI